jgi:hypothetical protein
VNNKLQDALDAINKYPDSNIPVRKLSLLIDVKHKTIAEKVRRKEIKSVFDGYRHNIPKQIAIDLAKRNESAILGWIRQKEIVEEYSIKQQSIAHICETHNLSRATDVCGHIRLPPKTVLALREILPNYMSQDVLDIDGEKYFSIVKLAEDMAVKLVPKATRKKFAEEKERIYKCIYSWVETNRIPYRKEEGRVKHYVPETTYNELTGLIRIKDAEDLTGYSKRTIYNWIDKGFINQVDVTDTYKMIPSYELDSILITKLQLKLAKSNSKRMPEVSDFNSLFWKETIRKVTSVSANFNKVKKNLENKDRLYYIESITGFTKPEIRAIYALKKRRNRASWSDLKLDKVKYDDSDTMTYGDCFEDEATPSPFDLMMNDELNSLLKGLPYDKRGLIESAFGISGERLSLIQLSERLLLSPHHIQDEINSILDELRLKLS